MWGLSTLRLLKLNALCWLIVMYIILLGNASISQCGDRKMMQMRVISSSIIRWVEEHITDLWMRMINRQWWNLPPTSIIIVNTEISNFTFYNLLSCHLNFPHYNKYNIIFLLRIINHCYSVFETMDLYKYDNYKT